MIYLETSFILLSYFVINSLCIDIAKSGSWVCCLPLSNHPLPFSTLFCKPGFCGFCQRALTFSSLGLSLTNDSHQQEIRRWEERGDICCPFPPLVEHGVSAFLSWGPQLLSAGSLSIQLWPQLQFPWVPVTALSLYPFRCRGGEGSPVFLVPRSFTLPRGFPYAHHCVSCPFIKLSSVTIYCLPGLWLIGQHCGLCLYSHRLYLSMAPTASSSLWLLSEHLMKEEIKPSMNYQT